VNSIQLYALKVRLGSVRFIISKAAPEIEATQLELNFSFAPIKLPTSEASTIQYGHRLCKCRVACYGINA
jgi:hypothetical protein